MLSWLCLQGKITRSVTCLYGMKIRRQGSIRTTKAGVYETDKLDGRIVVVGSLGYGNHPPFLSPVPKRKTSESRHSIVSIGLTLSQKFIEYISNSFLVNIFLGGNIANF